MGSNSGHESSTGSVCAVVFAYHDVGVRCLQVLLARGIHIPLVVTHTDDASENIWFGSVADTCRKHDIPFVTPSDAKGEDLLHRIQKIQPSFIFSFYYRFLLPKNLLQEAKIGAFNMHGSLLPKYRGRAPVNWAILFGEKETGVTLHEMVERPDAGRIVAQTKVPILPDETAHDIFGKLTPAAELTLWNVLPDLVSGKVDYLPNDISRGSYFGRRTPEDGLIDWSKPAQDVYNLYRAVAPPYPGAWTLVQGRKLVIRAASLTNISRGRYFKPGLAVLTDRVYGVCGDGNCIAIQTITEENGIPVEPYTLARLLEDSEISNGAYTPPKRILILGINGFIGHHLLRRILESTNWYILGMDISASRVGTVIGNESYNQRLEFRLGDIRAQKQWVENAMKTCDIVVPLAGIATPSTYITAPLDVFEIAFMANLTVIRLAAQHNKRIVFPSTSEVYGLCRDKEFDPETSELVCGPINKSRWIYSCCKQLLERIIFAYDEEGLNSTIIRPFNWIGHGLDCVGNAAPGSSRVTTQFLGHILRGENLTLVDGGNQKRSFLHIDDGIDALMKILEDESGITSGKIYNIGNPANTLSIAELATKMLQEASNISALKSRSSKVQIVSCPAEDYYGTGYQDMNHRVPNIARTCDDLGWMPRVTIDEAIADIIGDSVSQNGRQ